MLQLSSVMWWFKLIVFKFRPLDNVWTLGFQIAKSFFTPPVFSNLYAFNTFPFSCNKVVRKTVARRANLKPYRHDMNSSLLAFLDVLLFSLMVLISVQTQQNALHLHVTKHRLFLFLFLSSAYQLVVSLMTVTELFYLTQELENMLSELSSEPRYQLRRTTSFWSSAFVVLWQKLL